MKQFLFSKAVYRVELSKICSASEIVLNFIRPQNGDSFNMRNFEILACKGFLLNQRTDEKLEFFEENKEIWIFDDADELKTKIFYSLNDEDERKMCANAVYDKYVCSDIKKI